MIQFPNEIQSPKQLSPRFNGLLAGLVLLLATGAVLLYFHLTMTRDMSPLIRDCQARNAPLFPIPASA